VNSQLTTHFVDDLHRGDGAVVRVDVRLETALLYEVDELLDLVEILVVGFGGRQ
jgi:hypothetical protein